MTLLASFLVAIIAGAINSIAGGGTLLTFPSLLGLGLDGKVANATSTLGLWPASLGGAWGYREELRRGDRDLFLFLVPSFLGGATGAGLLFWTKPETFDLLVPWLILAATVLFMIQGPISRRLAGKGRVVGQRAPRRWTLILPLQFLVAVYGGYFGAGAGILMLAALGFLGVHDLHHRNGIKNLAATFINGIALVMFAMGGLVNGPVAASMAAGALLGGYLSAGLAKRIGQQRVRGIVVAVGLAATAWTAYRLRMG